MSVATLIADSVTDLLNAHAFTPSFTAERKLVPRVQRSELSNVVVNVVPNSLAGAPYDREAIQADYQIDVGIMQQVEDDDEAEILLGLMEDIQDYLADDAQRVLNVAALIPPYASDLLFDRERYDQEKIFHAVTSFIYRTTRQAA